MDKLEHAQNKECSICYNTENNINLTIVNSEKIFKSCRTYLGTYVFVEAVKKDTPVSFCNYCYESAVELIILEKQIEKLGTEISELNSLFLKNVLGRRNQFNKEKKDISNISTHPTDEYDTIDKSCGRHSNVLFKNLIVAKESVECGSKKGLPSNSQGTTEILGNPVNDIGLDANDHQNIIQSENCGIEVQCSNGQTVSKLVVSDNEQSEPYQDISGTIAQECQQKIKTSMSDLLKCLKMPIIQLERLKSCKSQKPKVIQQQNKITDPENCSSFSMSNEYLPSENIFLPEIAVLPENQENSVLIYAQPLETSIIAEEQMVNKYENDIKENAPYKCSICRQGFSKLCDLEDHEKLHNNVHHYPCSVCDKSFLDPSVLKLHENFHTAKRPFNFSIRSKSVRKRTQKHLNTNDIFDSGDTPFKCSICSKSFSSAGSLTRHKMLHSQTRPYKCSFCPKSFRSAGYLKIHETAHTGERPYKCSFCPKTCLNSRNLKYHEMTHTGETPYKCSFCPKSFRGSGHLKIHKMVHTGERPYKCSICSKSFGSKGDLKRHKIIHSGERPFKCSSCEMTFKQRYQLTQHERIHGNTTEEFILP